MKNKDIHENSISLPTPTLSIINPNIDLTSSLLHHKEVRITSHRQNERGGELLKERSEGLRAWKVCWK
jgi:hypothetical protein